MDDEAKLREVDFSEFEERFKLQMKEESQSTREKRQRIFSMPSDLVTFVENKRANIMCK